MASNTIRQHTFPDQSTLSAYITSNGEPRLKYQSANGDQLTSAIQPHIAMHPHIPHTGNSDNDLLLGDLFDSILKKVRKGETLPSYAVLMTMSNNMWNFIMPEPLSSDDSSPSTYKHQETLAEKLILVGNPFGAIRTGVGCNPSGDSSSD